MALFENLTSEGLEQTQDRLGGFQVLESGAYTGTIKVAYAGKAAQSNAQNVTFILTLEDGREYSETFWITNKNNENFFRNKQDNTKKIPLPGFTMVDDICLMTTNKSLAEQTVEEKVVNIYDPEERKQMPKGVPVLVETLGKQITFGIIKQLENKSEKDANGTYVPTPETREVNVTDKVFHYPTGLTVVEARNGGKAAEDAVFYAAWVEKNKGRTADRRKIKDGAPGAAGARNGKPGGPPQASNQGPAKTSSLFGKS